MDETRNFTDGGVDLLIVGQFAETADVSGVATGSLLMQTVTMVITGLSMGITIYVGQKIGERNQEEAGKAIGAGIVLFCFLDVILAVILAFFAKNFASALHAPQEAYVQTCQYIMVCGIGIVFIGLYNLLGAVFRGIGDSKTPLFTVFIACICNIVGDLVFVAVIGLGAMGAALATVMAQAFGIFPVDVSVRGTEYRRRDEREGSKGIAVRYRNIPVCGSCD